MTFANEKLEYDPAAGNTILDYQVSSTVEHIVEKINFRLSFIEITRSNVLQLTL